MRKLIGIVSEGPTDYMILKSVIDRITGENNRYLSLQPEKDMLGRYRNGWKGVWRWCKETESVKMLMEGIQPSMDAVVIQMDGDVIRKDFKRKILSWYKGAWREEKYDYLCLVYRERC